MGIRVRTSTSSMLGMPLTARLERDEQNAEASGKEL